MYSTLIGGSRDDYPNGGIAVDSSGNVYVTGTTYSSDFRTTADAFQPIDGGFVPLPPRNRVADGFVIKLKDDGSVMYSTYLGGLADDAGAGIAVDSLRNIYITGSAGADSRITGPSNFSLTQNAFKWTINDDPASDGSMKDTFLMKLNPAGAILFSTYLGGSGEDAGMRVKVDAGGNVYVAGYTTSANFPTVNASQPSFGGGLSDAFVAKIACSINPVGPISAPVAPVQVNTPIAASGNFTDQQVLNTHTAVWSWGDASVSSGTVTETDGSGSVTGSHIYSSAGVYTITLMVTDNFCSGQSVFQFVVVFDPSAGFVTGGGWINSPAGAYAPNPSLTGKANFGFVSRYRPGKVVPEGQTEFQFSVANLNFHSSTYEWLVVGGARAQYKGTGTINGAGSYKFILTAIDGQVAGGGGADKFRIKIWDSADVIVYDNQMGAGDDANPTTQLGGGSIVIHKK